MGLQESFLYLCGMVGARGIEPLASSVSRKRSPTELRAYLRIYKITFYPSVLSTSTSLTGPQQFMAIALHLSR
jgi:hypothetical protein